MELPDPSQKTEAIDLSQTSYKKSWPPPTTNAVEIRGEGKLAESDNLLHSAHLPTGHRLPTYADLSTCSLAQLEEMYERAGERFNDRIQLVERVRCDWALAVKGELQRTQEQGSPEEAFSETVTIGEQSYTIFGGTHCWGSGQEYHRIFENAIAEHKNILFEQGMARVFKYPRGAVAVADWAAGRNSEYFMIGLHAGLAFPLLVWEMLNPWQARGDMASLRQPIAIQNEIGGLPDHIALEIQEEQGIPLDFYQRRSAYQAAFLKHWHPGEDCAIHVGALHATQIRHFLQSGINDLHVEELGRQHALRADHSPLIYRMIYLAEWARGISVSMLGMLSGIAPWGAAAYGLNRLMVSLMN